MASPLSNLHKVLTDPTLYGLPPGELETTETHVSRLYFTPDHVYKQKKPVNFGFLDFTTLDKRFFFCQEEVRLNSRFAPDLYEGVSQLTREGAGFALDGAGEPVECLVRMKRLPRERMLSSLLQRRDPELPGLIARLGRHIRTLHDALPAALLNGHSSLELTELNWRENFRQTIPYIGSCIEKRLYAALEEYVFSRLEELRPFMAEREAAGWVRDTHGDLHAEHICFTDPITIYDCIEFNRRFRITDVTADIAFLAMDLDHAERRDLSAILLDAYLGKEREDAQLRELIRFWCIYRAAVRGKVTAFLLEGAATQDARDRICEEARSYFHLAAGYLTPPVAIILCGTMGSGKSTLARALARATGGAVLSSDRLRKERFPDPASASAPFGEGIYQASVSDRVYNELIGQAGVLLASRTPVILDASFLKRSHRDRAREALSPFGRVCLIQLLCDRQTAIQRMLERENTISDGRPPLLERQEQEAELPTNEESAGTVDSRENVEYNVGLILEHIQTGRRM